MLGGEIANELRVTLEIGPKGKKVVAVAPDWPGLERGAKTEEAALDRLQSYLPQHAPVAKRSLRGRGLRVTEGHVQNACVDGVDAPVDAVDHRSERALTVIVQDPGDGELDAVGSAHDPGPVQTRGDLPRY